jgi:hypothetical protein
MPTTHGAGRAWNFSHSLGRPTGEDNNGTGGFVWPVSLTVAPDDVLFVLSRGWGIPTYEDTGLDAGCRIGKTTIDEHHFGDFARGEFKWPTGIAISKNGNVYVSDEWENKIAWLPPDRIIPFPDRDFSGERLGDWGERGSQPGQIDGPSGIVFDENDDLYVVDGRNDRVQKFTKDGEFLRGWGSTGSGYGQFNRHWGITIDHEGFVYVADWGNNRIQKFTPDGEFVMSIGDEHDLNHPADVAVDSEGDVYVADWGNCRVQIFEPDGEVIAALTGDANIFSKAQQYVGTRDNVWQSFEVNSAHPVVTEMGRFGRVTGIEVTDDDRVIATDSRGRLQVYAKDKNFVLVAPP